MCKLSVEQREFLFPKAYNAAIRAGAAILEVYERGFGVDLKEDKTPITEADRRSHDLIKSYLGKTLIPILSEEGREMIYAERCGWDLFWMVDPLDGTKEFIKGNGEFTVNIALMADNKPVIGVIYVPYLKKMYFCDREAGSFLKENVEADPQAEFTLEQILKDARPLPLTEHGSQPLRIAMSRSHKTAETQAHVEEVLRRNPGALIVEQGSSYKFGLLAEGSIGYYPRMTHTYEWDTAAGELILEMAGGSMSSMEDGEKLRYNKESLLNPHFICRSKFGSHI